MKNCGIDGMTRRLRPVDGDGATRVDVNEEGSYGNYSNLCFDLHLLVEQLTAEPSGDPTTT